MEIPIMKEVELKLVRVQLPVRYDDEDIPYDFPLRSGDMWNADIEINTGKIIDWPEGKTGDMHMKVCDEGTYQLIDDSGDVVLWIEQDYVPNKLIPPLDGYGDYIHFIIDGGGIITNWYKEPNVDDFFGRRED